MSRNKIAEHMLSSEIMQYNTSITDFFPEVRSLPFPSRMRTSPQPTRLTTVRIEVSPREEIVPFYFEAPPRARVLFSRSQLSRVELGDVHNFLARTMYIKFVRVVHLSELFFPAPTTSNNNDIIQS